MYSYRGLGVISFLAMCAACSAHGPIDEEAAEAEAPVDPAPTMDGQSIPFPGHKDATSIVNDWAMAGGTGAELVVADALTACTTTNAEGATRGAWVVDASLRGLRAKMAATRAKFSPQPTSWLALRQDETKNFRPISGAPTSVPYATKYPVDYDSSRFRNPGAFDSAQSALDVAAVNLCIARSVEEHIQLGWNFLMPSADQRYLFETVRERAQIAMLQLADIAVALQSDDVSDATLAPSVKGLRWFAKNGLGPEGRSAADVVGIWAIDLADSARLQITATEKLSQLLARSASAREPRPDGSGVPNADDFRPASWRQRVLALLYGGNPLEGATAQPGAPPIVKAEQMATTVPWPTDKEVPYARAGSWTPGAIRFLQIAQEHDSLALLLKSPSYTGPASVANARIAGDWLYHDLEARIRTRACYKPPCDLQPPQTIPRSSQSNPAVALLNEWSAWKSYQLQPEDAEALASALVSVLPSPSEGSGFHVLGATNLVTLPGRQTPSLHFDRAFSLIARPLLETQTVYGRMGRHRVPAILRDSPAMDAIYVGQADGARSNANGLGDGSLLDGHRLMGVIPSLASVSDALLGIGAGSGTGGKPFKDRADAMKALVKAAIGESRFSLTPVEAVAGSNVTQVNSAGANGTNRTWRIRIVAPVGDAFWADTAGNYRISAVLDSKQVLGAMAEQSTRAGFSSIATLLSGTDVVQSAAIIKEASGAFVTTISLPEDRTPVFVARRRAPSGTEYRALGGEIKPWAIKTTAPDGSVVRLPADARYVVNDGDLTKIAVQTTTLDSFDPAMPLFDGFGQSRSVVPGRAELMDTDATHLMDFVAKAITSGTTRANAMHDQFLDPTLRRIQGNVTQSIDVAAVRAREGLRIKGTLETLCGSDSGGGVPNCDLEFVTVDAMGPTVAEMDALGCADKSGAPTSRPAPSWFSPGAEICANPKTLGDRTACELATQQGSFSFKVEMPKPVACAAWKLSGDFGRQGTLPDLLQKQLDAYWAYRNSVRALGLAGEALVHAAQAGDAERTLAATRLVNQQARVGLAEREALETMRKVSQSVLDAEQTVNEKAKELSDVTDRDVNDYMNAAKAAADGAKTGAMIGAAFGPWGALIGGVAGGVIGAVGSLFGGDREKEIHKLQNALNQATRAYNEVKRQEQELAGYYGVCRSHQQPPPGMEAKWGACPPDGKIDTIMELYANEKLENEQAQTVTLAQTLASLSQGKAQFAEKLSQTWSSASTVGSSSITVRNAIQTAKLDVERAKLEQELVVARARSEFAISQFFYGNDVYETFDELEATRQQLRDTRRVLEFAYGVNFSNKTSWVQNSPVPSAWIDQVYDYDLAPLRGGSGPGTGLSPRKLTIYASRIEDARTRFTGPYGVSIEQLAGYQQIEIPGPSAFDKQSVSTGDPAGGSKEVQVPNAEGSKWTVKCPQGSACAPGGGYCPMPARKVGPNGDMVLEGRFKDVCAPKAPDGARVVFSLDRWGRLNGGEVDEELSSRLNFRWGQMAIQLVSRDGLRNCEESDCSLQTSQVSYTLRHLGPYITTGADAHLALLPYFTAEVKGDAFDGMVRVEPSQPGDKGVWKLFQKQLFAVPLGGRYELEISKKNTAQVPLDLERLEHVQILQTRTTFFHIAQTSP